GYRGKSHDKREPVLVGERKISAPTDIKVPMGSVKEPKSVISARFYDVKTLDKEVSAALDIAYLPLELFSRVSKEQISEKCELGVLLPPVILDSEAENTEKMLKNAAVSGARHVLVANPGHIEMARRSGLKMHGDFRLNVFSNATALVFADKFEDVILAPELTLAQIRDVKIEKSVCVYGKIPLMVLENPLDTGVITDRRGVSFTVRHEGGRDIIFNSVPFYMGDKKAELEKAHICNKHFIFVTEGPREARFVLDNYKKNLPTRKDFRRFLT
ncbi:MAG: U32 family peptidase, partial [Clostridia bacterium]|nr:U32 family peptidase [Clostridia bacterium]